MSQPTTPHIGLLLTAVACLTLAGCGGDHAPANRSADVSAEIDALFEPLTEGKSPGAAVIVIERGQVLHVGGYGYADLERRIPISPETAFRLASVSKQFAAMAIMILAERGQLDYDDAMVEYLPELERFGDRITLRHLLVHTSGLPDYYDALEAESEGGMPDTKQAMRFLAGWGEPLFPAGERYEYSNPGYEMLALVVERSSGQTFSEFVQDNIFTPLGMNDSAVHDGSQGAIRNRALGYARKGDSFELDDEHVLNNIVGSGGIYSTVEDLYLWDQALYTEKLVQRATLEEAWSPARLAGGEEYPYGFGWRLGRHGGLGRRVSHSGGWVGFSTVIVRYPERQFGVIVLSNLGDFDGEEIAGRITDIFFPSALIDAVVATREEPHVTLAIHLTTVPKRTMDLLYGPSSVSRCNDGPWFPQRSDAI
jgi:CubicO group peptidase (beta-lactamase class C family)